MTPVIASFTPAAPTDGCPLRRVPAATNSAGKRHVNCPW
jgi:hypothetical protein